MLSERDYAEAVDSRSREPIYSRMSAAHIGIAGAGGLGSNIAAALARSGIGRLTIADHDTVELSNVNRQLYTPAHVGRAKAEVLAELIQEIDPFCKVEPHTVRVTEDNIAELFGGCDIIIEAFDDPEQKAMLVSTAMRLFPKKHIICGSGMAGMGDANAIKTRRVTPYLTVCGDGVTDVSDGDGLTAARVMICAGHMALEAVRIILDKSEKNTERGK